jgi:hypothetical protein
MDKTKTTASMVIATATLGFVVGLGLTRDPLKAASTGAVSMVSAAAGVFATGGNRRRLPQTHYAPAASPFVGSSSLATSQALQREQIAIFWDYENVRIPTQGTSAPLAELLVDYAKTLGHPRLKIVYANWSGRPLGSGQVRTRGPRNSPAHKEEVVVKALYSLGFEPIYVSMGKANSSDVKLAVDCLNAVHLDPNLHHIIIVTGDKDFIPLVNALKDLGKKVTIIGHADKVSEHLMLSADEFVSVSELLRTEAAAGMDEPIAQRDPENPGPQPISYEEAVRCLLDTVEAALAQGKSTRMETVGRLMRTTNPAFEGQIYTPNRQGKFTKFASFIAMVANEGKIRVETTESGFRELFLPEEDPEEESEFRSEAIATLEQDHWSVLLDQVQLILSEKGSLSFVPLLCMLSRSKQSGTLSFLSHGSLRKAVQRLIEIGVLEQEGEKNFQLNAQFGDRRSEFLATLMEEPAS